MRSPNLTVALLVALPLTSAAGLVGSSASHAVEKPATEPKASFVKGVLTVRGTGATERISIVRSGRRVKVLVAGKKVSLPKGYTNGKCDQIRILGLSGNDRLAVDSSKGALPEVVLVGGKGDDVLVGGERDDVLDGGQGNDVLRPGTGGHDTLDGGPGDDTFLVDGDVAGSATVLEESGLDHLSFAGTSLAIDINLGVMEMQHVTSAYSVTLPDLGMDELTGGEGDDNLLGGELPDRIHGGPGDDFIGRLFGVLGSDGHVWSGDAGDDTFQMFVACLGCHIGSTRLEDSSGNDTVSFAISAGSIKIDLRQDTWQHVSSAYDVRLAPGSTFENVIGGEANTVIGNDLPNYVKGGTGSDTMTGNGGADTFVMYGARTYPNASAVDTLTDFASGIDKVDLNGLTITGGIGTSTISVADGADDYGKITASNGHLWQVGDFT